MSFLTFDSCKMTLTVNDPEIESKYYRVPSSLFFFYLNHKLRMKFFGICFILFLASQNPNVCRIEAFLLILFP